MGTISISSTEIISFLLIFFRTGAILFTAPFFGSSNIPVRTRILLSFAIAVVLSLSLRGDDGSVIASGANNILWLQSQGTMGVSMAVIREVLLGVAIGYTAKLTFVGIQFAGQLVGHGMGFSMMRILDPTARGSVTITAQLNTVVATLIFLIIHGHHYILMGIAESFSRIPLAGWQPSASLVEHVNKCFAGVFSTGLRIAIPVMGAVFLAKVGMAFIARTIPQMNVFVVGFPIQISVGLMAIALSFPFFAKALCILFTSMRENIWVILSNG